MAANTILSGGVSQTPSPVRQNGTDSVPDLSRQSVAKRNLLASFQRTGTGYQHHRIFIQGTRFQTGEVRVTHESHNCEFPRSPPAIHRTKVFRPGNPCWLGAFARVSALQADLPYGTRQGVKFTLGATHHHRVYPMPHPPVRHFHSTKYKGLYVSIRMIPDIRRQAAVRRTVSRTSPLGTPDMTG